MTHWDGEERRKQANVDHDLLMKIDANLSNFMRRYDDHLIEHRETQEEVKELKKYLYMSLGIVSLIIFIMKLK